MAVAALAGERLGKELQPQRLGGCARGLRQQRGVGDQVFAPELLDVFERRVQADDERGGGRVSRLAFRLVLAFLGKVKIEARQLGLGDQSPRLFR